MKNIRNEKGQFVKGFGFWTGKKRSEETNKKISLAHKGKKRSEESRKKQSKTCKRLGIKPPSQEGKKLSKEHKRKISNANKGKKLSKEHIEKLRKINLGKVLSEERKKHLSLFWKGKKKPKEHTENIRKAKLGNKNPMFGKRFTCSEECRRKISDSKIGEKNPNYKGGITPENLKLRHGIEMSLWREAIFARDNWTCQKYKIKGGTLNAHHIKNFSSYPELRTSIENGITLSKKAHKEFHKKYGTKNNTREQLEEFLQD